MAMLPADSGFILGIHALAQAWPCLLVGWSVSFLLSIFLVRTQHLHGSLSIDSRIGIQKFHTLPTPRIGGIAIFMGPVAASMVFSNSALGALLGPLIISGIPALAFGLLEDITKEISVRLRLLATMASGVLGYSLTGMTISDVNIPGVDWMLSFTLVSVAFTALATGGVANAINIIDGFNGLSAGVVVIIALGFALISIRVDDAPLVLVSLILASTALGFMMVNWPMGRLFLGDGGAYFAGFALAWLAVLLLHRHGQISAWAPLMLCAYPVLEVGFSMLRRYRRGGGIGNPDRLHLHSLVNCRVVKRLFPSASRLARNSITGACMWLAALIPAAIGICFPTETPILAAGFVFCAFLYSAVYARLTQFVWCLGAATSRATSSALPSWRRKAP